MRRLTVARSVSVSLAILLVATLIPAVASLPARASEEVFSDTWSLANGAAWASSLWTVSTAGSGVVDVQGSEGHIRVSNASHGRAIASMAGVTDGEILLSFRFTETTNAARLIFWLRGSGTWSSPNDIYPASGYGLVLANNSANGFFQRRSGGTTTDIGSPTSIAAVTTTKQWLRLRVEDSSLSARVWTDGQTEPSTWELTVSDSVVTAAGVLQLGFRRQQGTTQRDVYLDNLVVTDLAASATGSISGAVWHDVDGDGLQESGEPGLDDVDVDLVDPATSTVLDTMVSGSDGTYMFDELASDDYRVDVDQTTLPAGYQLTTSNEPLEVTLTSGLDFLGGAIGFVATGPNVSLTSPLVDDVLFETEILTAIVVNSQNLDEVVFLQGTTEIGSDSQAPFEVEWDTTSVIDGEYTLTARATHLAGGSEDSDGIVVTVSNAMSSAGRVTTDYEEGSLTAEEYAEFGLWSLMNVDLLPERYQSESELVEEEDGTGQALEFLSVWEQLPPETQQEIDDFLTLVEGPGALAPLGFWAKPVGLEWLLQVDPYWDNCDGTNIVVLKVFPCSRTVFDDEVEARFRIYYQVGTGKDAVPSNPATDDDGGGGGIADNHIPDAVDAVAASLKDALETYTTTPMSYRNPTDLMYVALHRTNGVVTPFGNRVIQLSNAGQFSYLPRHELFHRIQYEYVGWADFLAQGNMRINWWQEATAVWAAHQVNATLQTTNYASRTDAFLSRPDRVLNAWDDFGGPRQYGAFLVAAFLEEKYPDLVRVTWELMDDGSTPLEAISTRLAFEGSSWEEELPVFWRANYLLNSWDPPEPYTDQDADAVWRADLALRTTAPRTTGDLDESAFDPTRWTALGLEAARPYRHPGRLEPGVSISGSATISEGGAWYVDLVPLIAGNGTIDLDVEVAPTESGAFSMAAEVLSFATYPTLCNPPETLNLTATGSTLTGSISISVDESCRFATLVVTSDNPFNGSQSQASLSWTATFVEGPNPNLAFELGTLQHWTATPISSTTSFEVRSDGQATAEDPYAAHVLLGASSSAPEVISRTIVRDGTTEGAVAVAGTAGAIATFEVTDTFGTRSVSVTLTGPNNWVTLTRPFFTAADEVIIRLIAERGTAASADVAFDGVYIYATG